MPRTAVSAKMIKDLRLEAYNGYMYRASAGYSVHDRIPGRIYARDEGSIQLSMNLSDIGGRIDMRAFAFRMVPTIVCVSCHQTPFRCSGEKNAGDIPCNEGTDNAPTQTCSNMSIVLKIIHALRTCTIIGHSYGSASLCCVRTSW